MTLSKVNADIIEWPKNLESKNFEKEKEPYELRKGTNVRDVVKA